MNSFHAISRNTSAGAAAVLCLILFTSSALASSTFDTSTTQLGVSVRQANVGGHPGCGTLTMRQFVPSPKGVQPLPPRLLGIMPLVGDTRQFWTYDLSVMPPKNKAIQATCRAVGTEVAIWVGDTEWGAEVEQGDVDNVLVAMETTTPLANEGGVFGNNTRLFGLPPVLVPGDPALTILIYKIPGYQGNLFDGYFRAEDLSAFNSACQTSSMVYCSNELPMIHVTSTDVGTPYMAGVIAHEFEHLIHYGQDPGEDPWLDESLAELAMIHAGYTDPGNLAYFTGNPASSLVVPPPVDYGACLLFGSYLWETLGDEGILALVADQANGQTSVETALGLGMTWEQFFGEWSLANIVDSPDVVWPLEHSLVKVEGLAVGQWGVDFASKSVTVPATATGYYRITPQLEGQALYLSVSGSADMRVLWWNQETQTGDLTEYLAGGAAELVLADDVITKGTLYLAFSNPSAASTTVTFAASLGPVTEQPDASPEAVYDIVSLPDMATDQDSIESDMSGVEAISLDSSNADLLPNNDIAAQDDAGTTPGKGGSSGGCTVSRENGSQDGKGLLLLVSMLGLMLCMTGRRGTKRGN